MNGDALKVFTTFSTELKINLAVLFAAGLCFWAGLAGLLPTLPLFVESLGASGQQIGFVMACFAIGLLAARPTFARLADEQGRKLVMLLGLGVVALAPFGYLLVQHLPPLAWEATLLEHTVVLNVSIMALMLIRAFHGLSIAAFAIAYSALIVDVSPPANRGELIGYMSLVNPLGLALGPALGGFLYEASGFFVAFLTMGILGICGFLCCLFAREAYRPAPLDGTTSHENHLFWRLLWTPRVRTPAIILMMIGLAFGTLSAFVPLFVRESGVDLNVGLIYTASAIASFTVRILVGRASDRYGRGRFITGSLALYALAMFAFWQAHTSIEFMLAGLLQGSAAGTLIPMIAALMGDRSWPNERGRIFGLAMVGFDVGIALAGPIFGSLADMIGYRSTFAMAGIVICLGVMIFITTSSKDLAHSLRFALSHGRDIYAVDN